MVQQETALTQPVGSIHFVFSDHPASGTNDISHMPLVYKSDDGSFIDYWCIA